MTAKKSTSYRLPKDLTTTVQENADREGRSISNLVAYLVRQALTLAVPKELFAELEQKAVAKKIPVNKLVIFYLRKGLESH